MNIPISKTAYVTEDGTFIATAQRSRPEKEGGSQPLTLHLDKHRSYSVYVGRICVFSGTWQEKDESPCHCAPLQVARNDYTTRLHYGIDRGDLDDLEAQTRAYLQTHPEHGTTPAKQVLYEAESTPPRGPHLNWKNRPSFGS